MESFLLLFKGLVFIVLEAAVLAMFGAVVIAGLYQIVRDKVRESRLQDEVAPEAGSTGSAGSTVPHHS